MKKNKLSNVINVDYTVLFVLNAAGMIMELVASRLLSPYFGNSNFVWTAIIGIILLAGSLGNILGGKISVKKHDRLVIAYLLVIASMCLSVIPMVGNGVLESIKALNFGTQTSAVIGSVVLFLLPSTIFGIVTPVIMKDRLDATKERGVESGKITAIIAIGSLVGTFAGGFWLIPALGTNLIFALLGVVSLVVANMLWWKTRREAPKLLSIVMFIVALVLSITSFVYINKPDETISIDTEYGRIIVENDNYNGQPVRFYKQSGAYSSATFLDQGKKYELVFDYLKKYDQMFNYLDVKNAAMIGGAAYQYPKYYISHFEDKNLDVIEIDPVSTEIAKKYFFLNDLINDYGDDRLGLYNADGRVFLDETDKKYDAILNDAFAGEVPVGTLATKEAAKIIKSRLTDGGVYMSNVLTSLEGEKSRFLRSEVKTLAEVFDNVYVVPIHKNVPETLFTNWMLIATDNDYIPADKITLETTDKDIVLTDDYCPVDSLVKTSYHD